MAVGEIFLTAFVQVLIQKLTSRELLNFVHREGVHEKLKKWSTTFSMIKAVLSDAEEKQLTSEVVKLWLDDLKNLAYDVEDVLDKFFAQLLRRKIENSHRASTSKVWGLIPTCCTSSSPGAFGLFMFKMNSEIKEITGRLKDITERKNKLGLNDIGRSEIEWKRPPSSSLPDGQVIGRDEDKKKIVQLLLRDQQSNLNFDVVGIVGMGGVGKTTLAGLVFHDDAMEHFDIKIWICVSDDFDSMMLTKAILKSINSSESENNDELNQLQERLSKALAGKKFLIVLDDVWNSKNDLHDLWVKVRPPFRFGAPGSKIIVTTREVNVAKLMGAIQHHNLECVSDDDCWQVFVQHAFFIRNTSELPNLGSLRDKILAKCNGLPLAARTLGGLFLRKEINEWEDILNDKLWTLSDHSNILPVLRLSYYHLPTHLKRCFAYCAILPEDYEFEERQLILLWMAEGLIHQPQGTRCMEDLGKEYFRGLLSRSFFQKSRKNESKYVMHDLMNDLAQWVGGETCFRLEDKQDGDNQCRIFEKARHSSYITAGCDGIQRLEAFSKVKHLRTFLPLGQSYYEKKYITSHFTLQILPKLQYLRVLSLNGYHITELPDSVGELKLLRYLDLSYTDLRRLPESIGSLYNLQTLLLECCRNLHELPTGMKNLINLRHLNNSNQESLKGMPPDLGKLTNLQTLPNFVLGKESGSSGIGDLGPLLHLRGTLNISGLENVNGAEDAAMANLGCKNGIDGLLLEWNKGEIADLDVLRSLQPPRMLKELTIKRYGGVRFPTWMEYPSIFSKMVLMRLEDCKGCRLLPPVGLLVSLKKLIIKGMSGVENIGSDFYGVGCLKPFPVLESLSFENMENWENWSQLETKAGIEGFPQLKELSLRRCPKLNGKLADSLPSLETLVVDGCEQLVVSIPAEGLTRLKELKVHGCKEMSSVWQDELRQLTSLEHLQIDDSSLRHPTLLQVGEEARQVELCLPAKVQTLELSYFVNLVKVPEVMHLTLLEELHIFGCTSLTCFPESGLPSSLRVLRIERCENLISLVRDDEYSSNCTPPPNSNPNCLELLKIQDCPSLKSISSAVNGSLPARFKNLYIEHCHDLEVLSSGKLPGTLRNLEIHCCDSLICLSSEGKLPDALESFHIQSCKMLKSLKSSEAGLPKALKRLRIIFCGQLESIADKFDDINNTCLESIDLSHCGNLRSVPEGLHHLINLSELCIIECKNLVSLPEGGLPASNLRELISDTVAYPKGMLQDLIFLQKLEISYSEGLTRLLEEEGFPPNLTCLTVYDLKEIKPLFHRKFLHRLTSLRSLSLIGEATDMVSFPPEPENEHEKDGRMGTLMLPKSLISLHISEFENLEKLSAGFQCVTSLQFLSIRACKKLKSLPVGGLPLSLLDLLIDNCPLLEKQCTRYEGRLWPLIAHIPCVSFFNF